MTKAHLIAWLGENLLASTFIGSGALLALLLATWPIRALWRWWRGRKAWRVYRFGKITPDTKPHPAGVKAFWPERYTQQHAIGDEHLTMEQLLERGIIKLEPVPPKPIPTVFADAKGYADSAARPDRVGRAEFEKLRYQVDTSFADAGYVDDFVADVKARLAALEAELLRHKDVSSSCKHEPEVRVFEGTGDCPIAYLYQHGVEVASRWKGQWGLSRVATPISRFTNDPDYTPELHGPEKDAIVAEWRAWKHYNHPGAV